MSNNLTRKGTGIQLLRVGGINSQYRETEIYLSAPQPMIINGKNTNIKYSTVFVPSSGETFIVERTYAAGFALQTPDLNKNSIAKLDKDGTWVPTENTDNATKIALQKDPKLSQSFTDSTNKSISTVFTRDTGKKITKQQLEKIKQGTQPNSTTPDDVLDTGEGEDPAVTQISPANITNSSQQLTEIFEEAGQVTAKITAQRAKISGGELYYPKKFPKKTDFIVFTAKSYGTKTFNNFGFTARENKETDESVKLPIQPGISDSNSVGWNEQTFNPAQVIGAGLAVGGITGGIEGFGSALGQIRNTANRSSTEIESAIVQFFTQQATGAQILPKMGGAVFNTNTELLFQGPQLRPFNFTFKLSPRSRGEATEIQKIIRFFKKNMAAATTSSELYLKAPNVFGIEYFLNNTQHPGINLIKDCALQSCTVNYTPEGSYMAYADGGMPSYELSLQFMELEPIYSSDYDDERANIDTHKIGY